MPKRYRLIAEFTEGKIEDRLDIYHLKNGERLINIANLEHFYSACYTKEDGLVLSEAWHINVNDFPPEVIDYTNFIVDQIATRRDEELRYDAVHYEILVEER